MRLFVTVGNSLDPFDRLLRMVDAALTQDWGGVCQLGSSNHRPARLECRRHLTRAEFEREIDAADAVVCHAGVGTIATALAHGHVPIVVPRRVGFGENVNDHQLEIAAALEREGRIILVQSASSLRDRLARHASREVVRGPRQHIDQALLLPLARALEQRRSARLPTIVQRVVLRALASIGPSRSRLLLEARR